MAKVGNIYTYDYVHYISDTAAASTVDFDNPVGDIQDLSTGFSLMGGGFTDMNESPNAVTNEAGYINQKSMATTVDSYNFQFSGNSEEIKSEGAVKSLMEVSENVRTGAQAERTLLVVNTHEDGSTATTLKARLFRVSVAISTINKPATEKVNFDWELNAVKDPVLGDFDPDTKTFTAVAFPAAGA